MIAWVKIALRNLVKNRRRSTVTALAIALGFAAVNLFAGFMEYMYDANRNAAIFARAGGHLTIFKKGFLEKGQLDPARYLLTSEEIDAIEAICQKNPDVSLVTPQLSISGLVTNGKISTIFMAHGIVPSTIDMFISRMNLSGMNKEGEWFEGRKLEDDKIYGIGMARGLARLLDLELGSDAVAFTHTIEGHINALNIEVFQLFNISAQVINDKFMRVPFSLAQKLYDTDGADRMVVLLTKTELTDRTRDQLEGAFSRRGLDLDIKTWKEMSRWYRKVKEMFDIIFLFIFIIVLFIVVMSVINTMSMAVLERTREIGTLRALGLKRRGLVLLFAIESSLLGAFGTIWGLLLTVFGWGMVYALEPKWTPPGLTNPVNLRIEIVPETMVYSALFLLAVCLIASLMPARRGAWSNIVDALGHV